MVGNAGVLLTRVLYEKRGNAKVFKIVDAGMNDLIRPTLYEGWHQIVPTRAPTTDFLEKTDVVGPICESADVLGKDRVLATPAAGEGLVVMDAGAYCMAMASSYTLKLPPAEWWVAEGGELQQIRRAITLDEHLRAFDGL